jgi:hypothetical protein
MMTKQGEQGGDDVVSWLALTAPGMLLSGAVLALTLMVAPRFAMFVYVAPAVRRAAGLLLLAQVLTTVLLLWRPARPWLEGAVSRLLLLEAFACGVVVGADSGLFRPGVPIALVVLAMGFEASGWAGFVHGSVGTAAGAVVAPWCGVAAPMLLVRGPSFPTALSIDTVFAGMRLPTGIPGLLARLAVDPFSGKPHFGDTLGPFSTTLSVETFFGTVPVGDSAALFVPALVLASVALWAGIALNLRRVRTTRVAHPASEQLAW